MSNQIVIDSDSRMSYQNDKRFVQIADAMILVARLHGFAILMHSNLEGTLFVPYTLNFGREAGMMAVPVKGLYNLKDQFPCEE